MQLSKENIAEYKKLYHDRYGETLSDEEAEKQAENLVRLLKAVYQPVLKEDVKEFVIKQLNKENYSG